MRTAQVEQEINPPADILVTLRFSRAEMQETETPSYKRRHFWNSHLCGSVIQYQNKILPSFHF